MARFRFKLNGVLKHRRFIERQKQRALAEIQHKMTALQLDLKAVESNAKQATDQLRSGKLVGNIDLGYLAAHRRFMLALQRKAIGIAQNMAVVQRDIDKAQADLLEAARSRKVMEKLRERAFERWALETSRKEAQEMDEIGMRLATEHLTH